MTLDDLSTTISNGFDPKVEVHSVDPSIYLIFCCVGEQRHPLLTAQGGDTLRFPSRHAALNKLRDAGVRHADFVHRSAYEEMIGFSHGNAKTEHRESITLQPATTPVNG